MEEEGKKGEVKKLRCVMYVYQLPIKNVIILYYKHIIIKIKNKTHGCWGFSSAA